MEIDFNESENSASINSSEDFLIKRNHCNNTSDWDHYCFVSTAGKNFI